MLHFRLSSKSTLEILCLGAHSDDIEIGCGGAILRLAMEHPSCRFHWVVFSATGVRAAEATRAATLFAGEDRLKSIDLHSFRDGFMPYVGGDVKVIFESLKLASNPDLIFTHSGHDAHQDHRLICELTWNTFRNHCILEYEIPKYDGDLGRPSVFVPLEKDVCERKVEYIVEAFTSQRSKHWFDKATFLSLMRLRGMESSSASGYAEAFYSRKMLIDEFSE